MKERVEWERCSIVARACRKRYVKPASVEEMRHKYLGTSTERARQSLCSCKSLPACGWIPNLDTMQRTGSFSTWWWPSERNWRAQLWALLRATRERVLATPEKSARQSCLKIYALFESTILDTRRELHRTGTGNRRNLSSDQLCNNHYPLPFTQ